MSRYVRLPEAVQVEETFGEASGGRHVGSVAAIGQSVAAAQAEPVAEVLVQLRVCGQPGLVPAETKRQRRSLWYLNSFVFD